MCPALFFTYTYRQHCDLLRSIATLAFVVASPRPEGTVILQGNNMLNASGGLIGLGHPVGATGVRMLLDCYKQVSGQAGETQITNAKNMATFNLGGSATTCASFIVGINE